MPSTSSRRRTERRGYNTSPSFDTKRKLVKKKKKSKALKAARPKDAEVDNKVPEPSRRPWSISLAVPADSVLGLSDGDAAAMAWGVARAAVINRVDEIVLVHRPVDGESSDAADVKAKEDAAAKKFEMLLCLAETPPELRKVMFPPKLCGLYGSLHTPHHSPHPKCPFIEAITTKSADGTCSVITADSQTREIESSIPKGARVTLALPDCTPIPSWTPRFQEGLYWGFSTRHCTWKTLLTEKSYSCPPDAEGSANYDFIVFSQKQKKLKVKASNSEAVETYLRHWLIMCGFEAYPHEIISNYSLPVTTSVPLSIAEAVMFSLAQCYALFLQFQGPRPELEEVEPESEAEDEKALTSNDDEESTDDKSEEVAGPEPKRRRVPSPVSTTSKSTTSTKRTPATKTTPPKSIKSTTSTKAAPSAKKTSTKHTPEKDVVVAVIKDHPLNPSRPPVPKPPKKTTKSTP
ncbi:methyltransferase [Pelomyxa schiedti]|nr:methyltransferase [Pelomyxa schiedti]